MTTEIFDEEDNMEEGSNTNVWCEHGLNPENRGFPDFRMGDATRWIIGAVVGIAALLLVILLPLSFQGVEYYQYGFKRQKSTGSVDTSHVYESGKYAIGPDAEFKKFPADAHTVRYIDVTVFTKNKLQVEITCTMQYFLRPHQLELLHRNFDIHYEEILENNALDALKGAATDFTTDEFIWNREQLEEALFKAVQERLGGKCCEKDCKGDSCVPGCKEYSKCDERDWGLFARVPYFQLGRLILPSELSEHLMEQLILQEEVQTELYKQEAQLVRKETERMVEEIDNSAGEIGQNATAQANLIVSVAEAEADALVEQARSEGLKLLYEEINISDESHKASFDYLRTLKGHKKAKITVDYQQMIAGSL